LITPSVHVNAQAHHHAAKKSNSSRQKRTLQAFAGRRKVVPSGAVNLPET
jgi:hypothetical protein